MNADEFATALQAKDIEMACPVCRSNDWRGVEDTIALQIRGNGTARYKVAPGVTHPEITAIAPSCGKCGHIRFFDLAFLTR